MDKIKIIGLQRSGTNYLDALLRFNFKDIFVYNATELFICWKHGLPYELYLYPETKERKLDTAGIKRIKDENCTVLLIRKPFDVWLKSIKNNRADLQHKRPSLFNNDNSVNVEKLREFHNSFYNTWEDVLVNEGVPFYNIEYLELVKSFSDVLTQFEFTRKNDTFQDIKKVNLSKEFTDDTRNYYLSFLK